MTRVLRRDEPDGVSRVTEIEWLIERNDDAPHGEKFVITLAELERFCAKLRKEGAQDATSIILKRRVDASAYYLRSLVVIT